MLKGFDPIIAKHPKAMILGSMPSVTSLDKQEYYGYAHNRFWKIMEAMYQMPIATYEQKKQIILEHGLILWDVIGACEREGSLDVNIHNEFVNPINEFIAQYNIIYVLCNGRKSYDLYRKHFGSIDVRCVYLPSTSNANRSIKEAEVFAKWIQALGMIKEG